MADPIGDSPKSSAEFNGLACGCYAGSDVRDPHGKATEDEPDLSLGQLLEQGNDLIEEWSTPETREALAASHSTSLS
jgi:hypothetical protein